MATVLTEMLAKLTLDADDFSKNLDKSTAGIKEWGEEATRAGTALSIGVTAPIIGLAAAAVASFADIDTLKRGLIAVTGSAEEANLQFARLTELAKLPGLGLPEVVKASMALQSAGLSASGAEAAIAAFGNALASVGRGRAELERVTVQLQQMASKPKVEMQDLKSIMEAVPQVAGIIRDRFGELSTEAINSQVNAQQFIQLIVEELGKLPTATGGVKNAMENMRDSLAQSFAKVGEAIAPIVIVFIDKLVPAIEAAANWFSNLSPGMQGFLLGTAAMVAAVGPLLVILGSLATGLSSVLAFLGGGAGLAAAFGALWPVVAAAAAAFATWKIGEWLYSMQPVKDAIGWLVDGLEQLWSWILKIPGAKALFEKAKEGVDALKDAFTSHTSATDKTKAATDSLGGSMFQFETKAKQSAEATKALKAEMDLLEATQKRDRDNFIYGAEARKKAEEQTKLNILAEAKLRAEMDALAESARNAQPDMEMWAETNERIADWYKQEPLVPPFLIDDDLVAKGKALGPDMARGAQEATGAWQEFGKEISTVLTNFSQDVGKNLIGLVLGIDRGKFNKDLEDQAGDLRSNLSKRTEEWEAYQADIVATSERLTFENATALQDELWGLQSNLGERRTAYEEYVDAASDTASALRSKFADALEDELSDLQDNLNDRREAYREFVEDTELSHTRNAEDLQDKLADEKQDTERNVADKTRIYQRDTDAIRRKIADELALGAKANQTRIRDWQIELQQKETDYKLYVQRQWEDYNEFASDQQTRYARETTDLNTELTRRTENFQEYEAEIAKKRQEAVDDNAAKLSSELANLQANIEKKKAEYDAFKTDIETKMDGLPAAYAEDLAKELADLNTSLTDKALAYDAYKLEIEGKLGDLVEKHRTAWGDVKTFFGTTLTGMGEALTSWVTEYLVGKLFAKLGELVTNILPGVGSAMTKVFGSGGSDVAGGAAGAAGGGGGLGGAAGSVAGGAAAWVGAIGSVVGAGAQVVGDVILARIHTDTGRIEENTRYAQLFLGGRADQGILGAIFATNELLGWGALTKASEQTRDMIAALGTSYINPSLDTLKDNTAAIRDAITGARPNVTINVNGALDPSAVANEVMSQLRLQMGLA